MSGIDDNVRLKPDPVCVYTDDFSTKTYYMNINSLRDPPAWHALEAHSRATRTLHLRRRFAKDVGQVGQHFS
jgi:hypothetical protein